MLTCEEILLFYARIKGVPSSEEKEHVVRVAATIPTHHLSSINTSGGVSVCVRHRCV